MTATALRSELEHALALCRAGDFAEAERTYRRLVLAHPDAPDAWNMLAVALYQRGALAEAFDAATRASSLRPKIAPYWLMRGNVALALKRIDEATASFSRAVELDPSFAEAHYRLGLSHQAASRLPAAIDAYRAALRHAPDVGEIYLQLAEAFIGKGAVSDAINAYQQAFARDSEGRLDRRSCLEWLGRLNFDALPPFWHAELERFFARGDLDKKPYVRAGLKALKTKPAFAATLRACAEGSPIEFDRTLNEALGDGLFRALLHECLMADAQFELFLTKLRAQLLLNAAARARTPVDFLCALASQNFNNEFVHAQSDAETAALPGLVETVEGALERGGEISEETLKDVLVVGSYRRLSGVRGIDSALAANASPALRRLFQRSVTDARIEQSLRPKIQSIGQTADSVSHAVRSMYEEHPYPRWFAIDREPAFPLSEWLERELPAMPPLVVPGPVRALVAGCGTGHDAIWLASNIAGSRVLGVDLSLSSLAYARRMAETMGVRNVELRQGDILALGALEERFDLIASTGVLHHMRDPMAGLRAVTGLLRPGGLMKLGFYSARARASVNAARARIAAENIGASEPEIRAFRQRVFAAPGDSLLGKLEYSKDFYSTSMCRDLLFHVQEHQYTLPQLGDMLAEAGLEFLGLAELTQDTLAQYRQLYPADTRMNDIACWDDYEQRYPDTFSGMFLFWCRLPETRSA